MKKKTRIAWLKKLKRWLVERALLFHAFLFPEWYSLQREFKA